MSVSNCAIELSRAGLVAMLLVGLVDFIFDRSYPDSPALHLIRGSELGLIALAPGTRFIDAICDDSILPFA